MKKNIITTLSFAIGALLSFNLSAEIERYPLQSINRPGIMPVGITQFETHAKLKNYKTVDITAGMLFGIANHLHGEFSYDGISVNPFTVKRTVNLGAKYNYYKMSHVSFSATAGLPIHIRDGEIIRNIKFGLPVVFF